MTIFGFTLLALALFVPGTTWGLDYRQHKFRTKIDHFAYHNNKTYEMRYMTADQYWDTNGGPIFFYPGNEDDIENFVSNTGLMWEWAPEFKALLVFAEHRFYGQSLPFGNRSFKSPQNLGYLTSEQALADYADLLLHLKATLPRAEKSPVVAIGGSYGGMLAAWFRMKYPHLITAALASSAPLNMFPGLAPCSAYSQAITEAFRQESEICTSAIRESWAVLEAMASTAKGVSDLQKKFNLCQTLHPNNYTLFRDWVRDTYATLALVNYPEAGSFLTPLPGNPVREACKFFIRASGNKSALVDAVQEAMNLYFNYTGYRKCNDVLIYHGETLTSWRFQGCTELVMPVCSDGVSDMFFPSAWNITEETEKCNQKFGVSPDLYKAVTMYGGSYLSTASNIVFSNGDLDPWASVGLKERPSDQVVLIMISGAAHHNDLRFSTPKDPESLTSARQIEKNFIRKWISDATSTSRPTHVVSNVSQSKHFFKYLF